MWLLSRAPCRACSPPPPSRAALSLPLEEKNQAQADGQRAPGPASVAASIHTRPLPFLLCTSQPSHVALDGLPGVHGLRLRVHVRVRVGSLASPLARLPACLLVRLDRDS